MDDGTTVRDIIEIPAGFSLGEVLSAQAASLYTACPDTVDAGWRHIDGAWLEPAAPEPMPEPGPETPDAARTAAMTKVAARRWQAETGGIIVQGMPIPTDRESQGLITGAATGCLIDPAQVVRWKTGATDEHGTPIFVELGSDAIKAVGLAVRGHVQACFDVEAAKCAEVAAKTTAADLTEWLANSLDVGWPA